VDFNRARRQFEGDAGAGQLVGFFAAAFDG